MASARYEVISSAGGGVVVWDGDMRDIVGILRGEPVSKASFTTELLRDSDYSPVLAIRRLDDA